jgi:hypothetical protein
MASLNAEGDAAAAAAAEDDEGMDNILVERDEEGNTWVIDLGSCVVMRKAAGPAEELQVVGRWDPVAQAVVLLQEEGNGAAAGIVAGGDISDITTTAAATTISGGSGTGDAADTAAAGAAAGGTGTRTVVTAAAEVAAALPPPPLAPPLAPPLSATALRQLSAVGYAVVDGALDEATAGQTRRELQTLVDNGGGGAGAGGGGGGNAVLHPMSGQGAAAGRSDAVAWLRWRGAAADGDGGGIPAPPLARAAVEMLAATAAQLAAEGWCGTGGGGSEDGAKDGGDGANPVLGPRAPPRSLLVPSAAQLAVYRGEGARYEQHLDNVQTPVRTQ